MSSTHFLNGRLVKESELLISPRDLGYSRGYAVFEFMVTSGGRPFMMDKHLERLYESAKSISLPLPWKKETIAEWVLLTLEANMPIEGDAAISIIISGGPSQTLSLPEAPTIVIMVDRRMGSPAQDYVDGVHVLLSEFQRYRPHAKTSNYAEAVCQFNVAPGGIHEVIYYSDTMIREGTRSNIFALIDGVLTTPKTDVLGGITRGIILEKLQLPIRVEARDFTVQELLSASEVFITATGKNIMPVIKINDTTIGGGEVGGVTSEVMAQFQSYFELYGRSL